MNIDKLQFFTIRRFADLIDRADGLACQFEDSIQKDELTRAVARIGAAFAAYWGDIDEWKKEGEAE